MIVLSVLKSSGKRGPNVRVAVWLHLVRASYVQDSGFWSWKVSQDDVQGLGAVIAGMTPEALLALALTLGVSASACRCMGRNTGSGSALLPPCERQRRCVELGSAATCCTGPYM